MWAKPAPLGSVAATDSLAGVAAPLLAGFGLATTAVIAQDPQHFRWPGASLIVLTAAMMLLMLSVQSGYHARAFIYSPGDVDEWWPEHRNDDERRQWLHETHAQDVERWRVWSTRSRRCYNAGSFVLTVAVATIAAPPAGAQEAGLRWTCSVLVLGGALLIAFSAVRRLGLVRRPDRTRSVG